MSEQEARIKILLEKYASFIHQTQEEKVRIIRLCGILAYLESAQSQNMSIDSCIKSLESFLKKVTKKYTGGDDNG